MTRRLMLLNLVLAAMLGGAWWQMKQTWEQARVREEALLGRRVAAAAAPDAPKMEQSQPVTATSYADVAMKMLFSRDRNPNVVIEEKPPEPVPEFPVTYGVLAFGDDLTVFMGEKAASPQKGFHAGDQIGAFKIASLTREDIVLEWKDKKFEKTIAELKAKGPAPAAQEAAAAPAPKIHQETGRVLVEGPPSPKMEEIVKKQQEASGGNPWISVGGTNHACAPGDSTPSGSVVNGFRKVQRPGMFGNNCFWEPAR